MALALKLFDLDTNRHRDCSRVPKPFFRSVICPPFEKVVLSTKLNHMDLPKKWIPMNWTELNLGKVWLWKEKQGTWKKILWLLIGGCQWVYAKMNAPPSFLARWWICASGGRRKKFATRCNILVITCKSSVPFLRATPLTSEENKFSGPLDLIN